MSYFQADLCVSPWQRCDFRLPESQQPPSTLFLFSACTRTQTLRGRGPRWSPAPATGAIEQTRAVRVSFPEENHLIWVSNNPHPPLLSCAAAGFNHHVGDTDRPTGLRETLWNILHLAMRNASVDFTRAPLKITERGGRERKKPILVSFCSAGSLQQLPVLFIPRKSADAL